MDDINSKIEFILNQQAQFAADITKLGTNLSQLTGFVVQIANAQQKTNEILANVAARIADLTERQAELTERQAELAERQAELAERQAELAERQAELAEQQGATDERLNLLINAVERHISDHK